MGEVLGTTQGCCDILVARRRVVVACVAEATTSDRAWRDTRNCTHLAITGGLKQTYWQLLAVLRRGKIHVGGGEWL
jgi:hypothetical protein